MSAIKKKSWYILFKRDFSLGMIFPSLGMWRSVDSSPVVHIDIHSKEEKTVRLTLATSGVGHFLPIFFFFLHTC